MAIDKEHIYNEIMNAIITTELKANMKLSDDFLMERFKISRTPLREILLRLHHEGLITIVPRMGTVVAPLEINALREIVELRRELEGFAGELAAKKRSESHLKTLRSIIEKFNEVKGHEPLDFEILAQLDAKFHIAIYEAADNIELTRCTNRMRILMLRYWYNAGFGGVKFLSHFDSLSEILEGIENRDPNMVRNATEVHISRFIDRLKELFK